MTGLGSKRAERMRRRRVRWQEARLLFWLMVPAVLCVFAAACRGPQKIGNKKFSAIVVSQHWETLTGKKLSYPKGDNPEIVSHLVEINPGGETGRHFHSGPTYIYVLEGVLVVEMDDGMSREYRAGQALLEDGRTWLNNKNPGTTATKYLAVIVGERGKPAMVFPGN